MKQSPFVLLAAALALPAAAPAQQPRPPAPPAAVLPAAAPAAPGWLGVSYDLRWLERDGECNALVMVEAVMQGSPAERAGLRAGDAIVGIDGDPAPAARLPLLPMRLVPGDSVRLRVERSGVVRELIAVADRRPGRPPLSALARAEAQGASGPTIRVMGDTLVASGLGPLQGAGPVVRGYWLAYPDGSTAYRRLVTRPRNDLDRRVSNLLRCAQPAQPARAPTVVRVDVERIQERADSLRVVMARRALESADGRRITVYRDVDASPHTVFRAEGGMAASLVGVAGAEVMGLEPELAEYFRGARHGVLVLRIAPGTPADHAGLRPGDVIMAGAGRDITTPAELRSALAGNAASPVELSVVRQGRRRAITMPRP